MSTSTKTKAKKSVKSSTAAKAVKKSSKSKTKTTKKPCKKTCKCIAPPVYDSINDEGYTEYPELTSEFPYGDNGFDAMDNEVGITKYYYVTNHDTGKKFVISGYELPFSFAKIIGEEETSGKDVYIIKISSPIAWLITRVFKVEAIDGDNLLVEAIDSL